MNHICVYLRYLRPEKIRQPISAFPTILRCPQLRDQAAKAGLTMYPTRCSIAERGGDMPEPGRRLWPAMEAAQAYTDMLERHFGDRLVSVVVYGSVARGEHTPLSDVDLLIVVRDLPDSYHARSRMLAVMEDDLLPLLLSLHRQGIHTSFSTTIKTPEEAQRLTPLYLDLVEDAVILYDQGFFFQGVLDRLRTRLAVLGARRLQRGKVRYWQLKPDYEWGEIVEL